MVEPEDEIYEDEFYEYETDSAEEGFVDETCEKYEDNDYEEYTPRTTVCGVGEKLKPLVVLLVICAAIICICAIVKR